MTMFRRGEAGHVPLPTKTETDEAHKLHREVVACSAVKYGPLIYMKVAFHNTGTSTVYLDEDGALHLLRALKALVPDNPDIDASPVITTAQGPAVQEGHMSAASTSPFLPSYSSK